jgi:hypothetical protein
VSYQIQTLEVNIEADFAELKEALRQLRIHGASPEISRAVRNAKHRLTENVQALLDAHAYELSVSLADKLREAINKGVQS